MPEPGQHELGKIVEKAVVAAQAASQQPQPVSFLAHVDPNAAPWDVYLNGRPRYRDDRDSRGTVATTTITIVIAIAAMGGAAVGRSV